MRRTLDSVKRQSVPLAPWAVVEDRSTDGTAAILDEYTTRLLYLRVVHYKDRGGCSRPGIPAISQRLSARVPAAGEANSDPDHQRMAASGVI